MAAGNFAVQRFQQLLDLFQRYRGVTDEITLFHSTTHAPLPLAVVQERSALLKQRMEAARKLCRRLRRKLKGRQLADSVTLIREDRDR